MIKFLLIWYTLRVCISCFIPACIPIFGKNLVPEILPNMPSTNQIAGFLNQPFLKNKMRKKAGFLYVYANSWD